MESHASAISRVETGRAVPSVDFIERYARAIARPISIDFGDPLPSPDEQLERLRRAFEGRVIERNGRYFPDDADFLLRFQADEDPKTLYLEMLWRIDRRGDDGWFYRGRWDRIDIRGAVAVAAMYHEVIDWRQIQSMLSQTKRKIDRRARRRARGIVAGA